MQSVESGDKLELANIGASLAADHEDDDSSLHHDSEMAHRSPHICSWSIQVSFVALLRKNIDFNCNS